MEDEIWNPQHSLTTGEFFLRVRTGFGCLEKNLQPTDGGVNSAPTNAARTELHSISHFITRTRVAQDLRIAHLLCPSNTCHPRVMSHSLPHLTLTTSTSSLSPISSTSPYLSTSPTFPTGATAPKECLSVTLPLATPWKKSQCGVCSVAMLQRKRRSAIFFFAFCSSRTWQCWALARLSTVVSFLEKWIAWSL